jgi:hypothetical protein
MRTCAMLASTNIQDACTVLGIATIAALLKIMIEGR